MATKTNEEKARDAYKQELLHCSNWKLRKRGVTAGVPVVDMKEAETKGPGDMINLILEKYDEGWRPAGEALNTPTEKPKETKAKTSKPKGNGAGKAAAKPAEPDPEPETAPAPDPEPQEEAAVDPWDEPVEAGSDPGDDALLAELGLEEAADTPQHPDADVMMSTAPPREELPNGEVSGIEDKVDQIQDLLTDIAAAVIEANDKVTAIEARLKAVHLKVVEHKEIAVRAWALLCNRVGVSNLSTALKKGAEQASSIINGK